MEDSCPATPLVLVERDSKSPLQVSISSPESDGMKSPDSRCVICLGKLQNKSFTDSCLHQFCFQCLLQWSKVKPECPLCKQPFKSIIHNVRSNMDYDQYHIEHGDPHYVLSDLVRSYNFDLIQVDRRFRYRSTMTGEYFRELAQSFLAHTRRIPEDSYQISPMVPLDPSPPSTRRHSNRLHRSRQRGSCDFRRNVYLQDLWVQDLADISGRYRECTPQFYRDNPAQVHRIIPWLNRELKILLSNCNSQAYVLSQIISSLTQHSIRSREFRQLIQPFFGNLTDHFIHEFYTFARSVYDIAGFDQNAVYVTNPNYAREVQEIMSSSEDSDVEVLETVIDEGTIKPEKTHRCGFKKSLLKRAHDDKVEEPIAGPSGIGTASLSDPIEICESEDEIKILNYVKPEPEIVTLSSGDESSVQSSLDLQSNKDSKHKKSLQVSSDYESSTEDRKNESGKGKCKASGFGLKGKQKNKYIKSKRNRSRSRSESTEGKSENKSSRSDSKSESEFENRKKREDKGGSRSEKKKENKSNKKRGSSSKSSITSKVKSQFEELRSFSYNSSTTTKSDLPHSYCSRTGSGSSRSLSSSSSSSSSFRRSRSRSPSCTSNSRSSESGFSFGSSKSSEHKLFRKSKKKSSKALFKKYKKKNKHKSSQGKKKKHVDADVEEKKKIRSCVIIPDSCVSSFRQNKPSTFTYWSMAPNPAATRYYKRRDNSGKTKAWDNVREKRSNKRVRDSSSEFSSDSSEKYLKSRSKDSWHKSFSTRASHENISTASWAFNKKLSKKRSDDSGSGDSSSKNFATGASHESTSSSASSFSSSNTHTTATSKMNSSSSSATDGSH